jgi:hypothetical protein
MTNPGIRAGVVGTAALVLALAAGCAQSSSHLADPDPTTTVSCGLVICHHGSPGQPCTIAGSPGRIAMAPDKLVCSLSSRKSPSVSSAPPPSSPTLHITTQMGWSVTYVRGRAPVFRLHRPPLAKITSASPACRVVATNPGTALQPVHYVNVVYLDKAGNKIAADKVTLPVIGIGPGNTVRAVAAVPRGTVSCRAQGWSPG